MRQKEGGQHVVDSDVIPLPVPGRSSIVKTVAFAVTDNDHLGPFEKGTCSFAIWCWIDDETDARQLASFQFGMAEETAKLFNHLHSTGDATQQFLRRLGFEGWYGGWLKGSIAKAVKSSQP